MYVSKREKKSAKICPKKCKPNIENPISFISLDFKLCSFEFERTLFLSIDLQCGDFLKKKLIHIILYKK